MTRWELGILFDANQAAVLEMRGWAVRVAVWVFGRLFVGGRLC